MRGVLERLRFKEDRAVRGAARTFVVSFPNMRMPRRSPLAVVHCEPGSPGKWSMVPLDPPLPWPSGATGLCYWGSKIAVCLQGGWREGKMVPDRVAILDPDQGWGVHSYFDLPSLSDPHSVAAYGNKLYIAAAGEDSIYRAKLDEKQWHLQRHWTLPGSSGEEDENHINGLSFYRGRLLTSGFERKTDDDWESAKDGFVYDVSAGRYVMRGINHPHSVLAAGKEVMTCESKESRIVSSSRTVADFSLGYLRGLFVDSHYLYAGVSKRRRFSKSGAEGKADEKTSRAYEGECGVFRMDRQTSEIEQVADFTEHRNEIYDLLPLR